MTAKKQKSEMTNYTDPTVLETNIWKISAFFDYLDVRWQEEKRYEDLQGYIEELNKRCTELGFKFMSANFDIHLMRFKVIFTDEPNNVIVKVSSKSITYRATICKSKKK